MAKEEEQRPSVLRLRSGVDWELEEEADELLARSRDGITKHSEKNDFLNESQLALRRSREIHPRQGFPEKNIISGLYKRAYNPLSRNTTRNRGSEPEWE